MRRLVALGLVLCLSVGAAVAWGYWSTTSVPGGAGAAAAVTVDQGATPTAVLTGQAVTVSWSASTLSNGQPVTGYTVARYDAASLAEQTILTSCTGTVTATTCTEDNVPAGSWKYAVTPVIGANWRGAESARSATVVTDPVAPTNSISLSATGGAAHLTGTTVHYRGSSAGSLRLTNAVSDAGSGPASSTTGALTGTATGWSHTPSTVSTPAGGPYESAPFTWEASTTSSPGVGVTGRDVAGNAVVTNLTFANDSTAPTAGTVSYPDGFVSGRSVSVTFTTGTDAGSGVATRRLQRAQATLTDSTCGSFGSFVDIGSVDPASPYADSFLKPACYRYRYVVTDGVGNQHVATSANVAKVGYAGAVTATPGLLSHWRLGEGAATLTSADTFTAASGSALAGRTPDVGGGAWVHLAGAAEAVIDGGRVRRNLALFDLNAYSIDYVNVAPAAADYSVEADLGVRSNLSGDMVGVVGRLNTSTNTFYMARWEQANSSWNLVKYSNGTVSRLAVLDGQGALAVNESYRIRLEMIGTALKLYVNGVEKLAATDASITAAGRAGIMDGNSAALAVMPDKTSSTGIHLDNFQVAPASYPRAVDSKGSNTGDYRFGPTLGVPGALASDANTAATFDGVDDHGIVARQIADDMSIELWFKSTQGIGTGASWWEGAGLVDAEVSGAFNDFGISLRSDGRVVAGVGAPDVSIVSSSSGHADGSWHHVVFTRTRSSGAMVLYVDGVAVGSATGSTASLTSSAYISFARLATGNNYYAGSLDEIAVYNTVLTPSTVTDHYQLGATSASDSSGPTGGSVDATGLVGTGSRYSTSTTLSLSLAKGSDPSGLADSGAELQRASATLTNGSCGTFGGYTLVAGGNDPASPKSDTVADQACYRYQYVVPDALGNTTTYTSPNIKVDTTAPDAPSLAFSAFTNTYWPGAGTTVYYRPAAASGGFTATADATDAASGIASYEFPALGPGWTSTPGALGVSSYAWSGAPGAPGTRNVTATNNATRTSADAPFTLTADDAAPSAGTVSYVDGSTTGGTVSVSFTTGTDAASGVGTRLLQRASAPLTGTTCGTFGPFATVTNGTNPTSPVVDSIATGSCYKYQYVVSDRVGNQHTATSTNVAHTPYAAHWTFDQGTGTSAPDSSGNTNHATLAAGASWTTGKVGPYAVNLTGATNSFVTAPAPVVDTSRSYSVSAWVKPSNLTGHRTVASMDGSSISPFYLQMLNGQFLFTTRSNDSTGSVATTLAGSTAVAGTWYHVAGVHDAVARTITLYVNGVAQGSTAFSSPWKADGATAVGRAKWGGANVDFFGGAIDDVRLEGRVLSAGEISALAVDPTYSDAVSGTSGLAGYWRLGESTTSSDTFTGAAGATLQSRTGELGAAWTKHAASSTDAQLTSAGRLRKSGAGTFGALYSASAVPSGADYTVEADVHLASALANDMAGVVGRLDGSSYYIARYEATPQKWVLYGVVNGAWTWLGESAQPLTAGTSYRLSLAMSGTSIRVLVNGVQQISVVNAAISASGRGGVALGLGAVGTTVTDTTGLHLDNFQVTPSLTDSAGTNAGIATGGITLGATGGPSGEPNTAAVFDGVNDAVVVPDAAALRPATVSIEAWVRPNAGIPNFASVATKTTTDSWSDGYGMFALNGGIAFWVNNDDVNRVFTPALPAGTWSHVVGTYDGSMVRIYRNGTLVQSFAHSAPLTHSSSPLLIGNAAGVGFHWAGGLDEVAVYSRALTATEVAQHHASGQ